MKKTLTLACGLLALVLLASVASAQVVGSKHDLGVGGGASAGLLATDVNRVCVFCHTPHMAAGASGQYPLWNHNLSTVANYGTYSSATFPAGDIADIGGASPGTAAISNLCMSCHDGTVGVGALYNDPNEDATPPPSNVGATISGSAELGTDLSDDHPVNFTYDASRASNDGELQDPTDVNVSALLDGAGKVQCSSCHDPHKTTYTPFLVRDNADSALCLDCHVK